MGDAETRQVARTVAETPNETLAVAATAGLGARPNARKPNAKTDNADFIDLPFSFLEKAHFEEKTTMRFLSAPLGRTSVLRVSLFSPRTSNAARNREAADDERPTYSPEMLVWGVPTIFFGRGSAGSVLAYRVSRPLSGMTGDPDFGRQLAESAQCTRRDGQQTFSGPEYMVADSSPTCLSRENSGIPSLLAGFVE
jgi:hypothetical protein